MDGNSTSDRDHLNQNLTISILAFTVAGFCLSTYAACKMLWASATNSSPRNISNEEAKLIAISIKDNIIESLSKDKDFIITVAGAVAEEGNI